MAAKHGKRYREAEELIDKDKNYQPQEAIALTKKTASAKFDETVELHIRTGADPRHADQMVRGVALLPHGVGKTIRVVVFTEGEAVAVAQEAGADYIGDDDLIKKIEGGWAEFEVAVATPDQMGKIGRLGRYLGRKGLMPNPRTGTVVQPGEIAGAIEQARQGRVELRMDKTAIVHTAIGRVSFEEAALVENLATVVTTLLRAKPDQVKGQLIKNATIATTMGPGIQLDLSELESGAV